jgi:hypothetical protein
MTSTTPPSTTPLGTTQASTAPSGSSPASRPGPASTVSRPVLVRRSAARILRRLAGPAGAAIAVASLGAVTGCSAAPHAAENPAPATVTVTAAPPSAAASANSSAMAPSAPSPGPSSAAPPAPATAPVLGQPAGVFASGAGFGQVRPTRIFNGGDPSGLVTGIVWTSWGGSRATGTGTSVYVGPGQSVATGTEQTATVVAFRLGTCDGKLMYRALEWYFPQHGQSFSATHYENICAGSYVPAS